MSFLYFSENRNDIKNRSIIWLAGLFFIVFGFGYAISDIITSAKFFDSLGLQPVIQVLDLANQTTEAWMFGISLFIFQIYSGYKIAIAKRKTEKNIWIIALIAVAAFDTYTDSDFRSYGYQPHLIINSLLVSILVYNIFSELAIGFGFREVISNVDAPIAVLRDVFAGFQSGAKHKSSFQSSQKGPPPQQKKGKPPQYKPQQNKGKQPPFRPKNFLERLSGSDRFTADDLEDMRQARARHNPPEE